MMQDRHNAWDTLTPRQKRLRLRQDLLEQMVTVAREQGLNLAVTQIIRAIDQTTYSAEELEMQHRAYETWRRARRTSPRLIW